MKSEINIEFIELTWLGKKIFIFEDHQTALLCWKKAYDEGIIQKNNTLLHIDKHTDFCFNVKLINESSNFLKLDFESAQKFVKNKLAKDSAEFIVTGMFANLIKDGISIHFDIGSDYGEFVKGNYSTTDKRFFKDSNGNEHNYYLYDTQNLEGLIGYQSLIGDSCIHQDVNDLFENSKTILLDIDLDFFTYSYDGSFPRHREDIKRQINSSSFQEILNKANVITIALEPNHCGNQEFCSEIFEIVVKHLFKNQKLIDEVKDKFLKN